MTVLDALKVNFSFILFRYIHRQFLVVGSYFKQWNQRNCQVTRFLFGSNVNINNKITVYVYCFYALILWLYRYGRKKSTTCGLVVASLASIIAVSIPYEQTRKGSIIYFDFLFNSINRSSILQFICKITFWKRELRLAKSRVSLAVCKTWKGSRHYTPSQAPSWTIWRIYALIKKAFPLQFLVLPNFYSCFYNCMETREMFSIS